MTVSDITTETMPDARTNKIAAIKALRCMFPGLGLRAAENMVGTTVASLNPPAVTYEAYLVKSDIRPDIIGPIMYQDPPALLYPPESYCKCLVTIAPID